jgi:alpha-D-ribose 1-methylphosphonate 5-triphosphate synthase subunit PhnH
MTAALEVPLASGFADPVLMSQRVFRAALEAMARPGTIAAVDAEVAVPPLGRAATALVLALADFETAIWLDQAARPAAAYFRFHAGTPISDEPDGGAFAVAHRAADLPPLERFALGSDDYPDRSTTVIVEVEDLSVPGGLVLTGPGIDGRRRLGVAGLRADFWPQWHANRRLFPRGVDLVLAAGPRFVALPRTTAVEIEPCT